MEHSKFTLKDVQNVYSGAEKDLWELVMGEQIHIGGFASSMELAQRAGIKEGMKGVDLCCCVGAGMRFLSRNFKVSMAGVDATDRVLGEAAERAKKEGLEAKLEFKKGDVTAVPYPNSTFDFVWGEDAWCYVEDKGKLVSEAARILKPGGTIAFTDWIEGHNKLTKDEASRIFDFMKFPYMETLEGYKNLLEKNGFEVIEATDQNQYFADHIALYIDMLTKQFTYDALRIMGNDANMMQAMGGEMAFMRDMARAGRFSRGRFIGRKK
ncbi:MAG: methyltransferase domain-containing protein [Caldisericales bacterium]|nr:methyltransferase domain-containing protein [Caldisericales bacterium]